MSDAIVAAFNDATTWHEALAAIKGNTSALLDAARLSKLNFLPDDGDLEQAIGLGVIEIKTLFGSFTSIDEIKAVAGRQIDVEHAKHEFVVAIGNANTVDDMRLAFEQAQRLHDDRQSLIQEWSSNDDPVIKAHAAQLDADAYTLVLRNLVSHLNNGNYLEALGEEMLAAREENGPFDEIGILIAAIDNAARAIDSDGVVTSFNAAADWEAMLAAVKDNASALLDNDHLAKLNALPDDGIHEHAVGSGLAEFRTLFGDFTSVDQIKAAVEKQLDIEHGRFSALLAINGADDAISMATVLSHHIAVLSQHRQDLIAQWSASGDPDAVARAAELDGEVYTRILNEISSRLDNVPYQSELAARLLAARQNGPFFDIDTFIAALDAADEAIDATHDAVISGTDSGFVSEDGQESIGAGLIIEDGDWGENNFKLVAAGDLQKQYGAFTFNSTTGQWNFKLNSDAQSLKQDQQVQHILLVESLDGTATRTITVTISGRNDTSVAAVDGNSVSGAEDTTIAGQVPAGTDVDGDSLTYVLVQPVDGLTFHEDGTFSYEPAVDFRGDITFQYRVLDGNGGTSQPQTFTIKVGTVNDAPREILLSNTRVEENAQAGTVVGTLTGLDVDGDTLTFSLVDNAGERFAISNGQLVVQDGVRLDYEQATAHTVTIRITDASQASYTETFIIGVDNVTSESISGSSAADLLIGEVSSSVSSRSLMRLSLQMKPLTTRWSKNSTQPTLGRKPWLPSKAIPRLCLMQITWQSWMIFLTIKVVSRLSVLVFSRSKIFSATTPMWLTLRRLSSVRSMWSTPSSNSLPNLTLQQPPSR
ncbi:VCBS domain-containing protein [Microvirga sp. BT689]|uniref:Ig-like domain-containing protein n=1 Tax=Microvirga arvi TaxID=2778731 RepID=UPI00194E59CF|nr:Ig-like domain-containing protein [Microvirga arvi]MBM6580377.1 VCBS domain-containing protein [Microvirga arvi]